MKFIRFFISFTIIFICGTSTSYGVNNEIMDIQMDGLDIKNFVTKSKEYTKDSLPELDINSVLKNAITGKVDNVKLIRLFLGVFGQEFLKSVSVISSIIVVIIIHSILKVISDGLENKSVGHVIYYVEYILIVTLMLNNFSEVINMVKESIQNLVALMNMLVPILITLIITTGNVVSAGMLQPIILCLLTIIGNFIVSVIIPFILISTALGIVSNISDKIQLDKLSNFFKSSAVWFLSVILTFFVGVISLEGTLSSSIDGITAKTAKTAVSNAIPVVGKILGDAVDTVLGCGVILKNAMGIVGVIIIISICITPIIKLLCLMTVYYLGSALCEPIADTKIVKLLSKMGDAFKMLFAVLSGVSVMLIIGVTLVIKISNSGIMYN